MHRKPFKTINSNDKPYKSFQNNHGDYNLAHGIYKPCRLIHAVIYKWTISYSLILTNIHHNTKLTKFDK